MTMTEHTKTVHFSSDGAAFDHSYVDVLGLAAEVQRIEQQGFGRPIISRINGDERVVRVGKREFRMPVDRTFMNFIIFHMFEVVLGLDWLYEQYKGDEISDHPIVLWENCRLSQKLQGGPSNASQASHRLAYALFLIADHYEQYDQPFYDRLVSRLRKLNGSQFYELISEIYAAALMLRAGFKLKYLDESGTDTSTAEFSAKHPLADRTYSVEVKTISIASKETDRPTRIERPLNAALKKALPGERLIFINPSVPEDIDLSTGVGWIEEAFSRIRIAEARDSKLPSAFVVLMNFPYHWDLENLSSGGIIALTGFRNEYLSPVLDNSLTASVKARSDFARLEKDRPEISVLNLALAHGGVVPVTFDGSMRQLNKEEGTGRRRWVIGRQYPLFDERGAEVTATLRAATVDVTKGVMSGTFVDANGGKHDLHRDMTALELDAFDDHPNTFFGALIPVTPPAQDGRAAILMFQEVAVMWGRDALLAHLASSITSEEAASMSDAELALRLASEVIASFGILDRA